jgi:hypothetical protein
VAPLLSAEDTQTAFRNLDSMVREIVPANAPEAAPPPPDMAGLAVGEPIEMLINRVYRLTNSQVPVTLAGLSRDQARFRVNGEETDILLTQSIALPAPVAHCSLVFLGSSITGSGWYSSGDATATVSVDCRASAPGAALTDHQAPADEKQVRD